MFAILTHLQQHDQFLNVATMFQTLFIYDTFIYRTLLYFYLYVVKFVCCIFAVCMDAYTTYRHFLTPLKQTTYKKSVVKFLILLQCFRLISLSVPSFMEFFHIFDMFSKSSTADLYDGKC